MSRDFHAMAGVGKGRGCGGVRVPQAVEQGWESGWGQSTGQGGGRVRGLAGVIPSLSWVPGASWEDTLC